MILSLDLSRHCGWTRGQPGARPDYGVMELCGIEDLGRQGAQFSDGLKQLFAFGVPTQIIAESDVNLHKQNAADVAEMQLGMLYFLRVLCFRQKIPLYRATAGAARMLVMGRSHFDEKGDAKRAVIEHVNSLGLPTLDHNIADAIILWLYRCNPKNRAKRVQ